MSDQIERQCPDCTDTVCCICQGINESCLDMPSHPGPSRDKKRIKELEAEIARLTDSEDSRVVVLEAENKRLTEKVEEQETTLTWGAETIKRLKGENKRLRDDLGSARDWEAWERMQKRIAELEAMWASAKPVLDAAEEWYAAFEYEELDENYSAEERVLFNTIKANPSCPSCGPGGCAGHTRKPSETVQPTERYTVWLGSCVVHPETHWQWSCQMCPASRCFPASSPADVRAAAERHVATQHKLPVCAECGHRHRWGGECADHPWTDACPYDADANCEAGRSETVAEKPTGGISEKTMAAIAAYARATGMIPSDVAEGLSSTDTTAVERG